MNSGKISSTIDDEYEKRERIVGFITIVLCILVIVALRHSLDIVFLQNEKEVTIEFQTTETIESIDRMVEEYNKKHALDSNRNEALVYIIEKYMLENETFGE